MNDRLLVQRRETAGWSEDAVFELTITAAVAEAHRRLAAGLEAMREGGS